MTNNLTNLLKSTSIVILISFLGGLGAYMIHLHFWAAFIILFVIQYILFSFVGGIITSYFTQKTRQKELDFLEPLSTILECAYCAKTNLMTFFPNQTERIEFECDKCKKKNLVNINFTVARVTDYVEVPNLTSIPLIDEKEQK